MLKDEEIKIFVYGRMRRSRLINDNDIIAMVKHASVITFFMSIIIVKAIMRDSIISLFSIPGMWYRIAI